MRLFSRLRGSSQKVKPLPNNIDNCLINPYFSAKFIGSMCVAKPMNGYEIMATVRQTRYEFKRRRFLKRKIKMKISLQEILICDEESKGFNNDMILMRHSLCRVYYASHDNQDAKIFGYFADSDHKAHLQCNVFKADGEVQANAIIQEIGRCFDMFHMASFKSPFCKELVYEESISNQDSKSSGFEDDGDDAVDSTSGDMYKICDDLRKLQKQSEEYQKELSDVRCRLRKLETKVAENLPVYLQACHSNVEYCKDEKRSRPLPPRNCQFKPIDRKIPAKDLTSISPFCRSNRVKSSESAIYQVIASNQTKSDVVGKCTNWRAICTQLNRIGEAKKRPATGSGFFHC